MKLINTLCIYALIITLILCVGCSKKGDVKAPDIQPLSGLATLRVSSITAKSAVVDGNLLSGGNSNTAIAWGFCWSTNHSPTIADSKLNIPLTQNLIDTITNLQETTTYYVRAYATNPAGTIYGNELSFTTLTLAPVVQLNNVFFLSSDFAEIDCHVLSPGNSPVLKAGVCWSTSPNPTIANDTALADFTLGEFLPFMTKLTVNKTYYVRAFATNSDGIGYSDSTITIIPAYYIGEVFGGGKIFYIAPNKIHGLIAATVDQAAGDAWDNNSTATWTYAWNTDDGAPNTDKIIATLGLGSYAAALCRNYTGGGYTDWYLPSLDELGDLFLAKTAIGNITPYYYWSSTEDQNYIASAWVIRMDSQTGEQQTWTKNNSFVVRAIRKF